MTDERRKARDQAIKARRGWKPTPSQEEADLVAMGVPTGEVPKQPDGSPEDPHEANRRAMWPAKKPGGGYETR
jgi:hypothetical protein